MKSRSDGRITGQLRPLILDTNVPGAAPGRVQVSAGKTTVLCTASLTDQVPPWLAGKGKGWVTAEYNMLPGSTAPRKPRDRGTKLDGRSSEIQRFIGRSLRAVVDLESLGERMITVDCDVLEADGGTRTASITGGFVALVEALRSITETERPASSPIRDTVAAISAGIVEGVPLLDLDYREDVSAEVDMNIVMTGGQQFVEVQGCGEEATFSGAQLAALIELAQQGIAELTQLQRQSLGIGWPLPE